MARSFLQTRRRTDNTLRQKDIPCLHCCISDTWFSSRPNHTRLRKMNEKEVLSESSDFKPIKFDETQIEGQISQLSQQEDVPDAVVDADTALSKRLDHKFDLHIVPWIFGIW